MYAALYTRKQDFCKNVKFGSVALAFDYVSCFNASLSRYHLVNLFCITICKVLYRPDHVSIKSKGRENSSAAKNDRLEYSVIVKGPKFTVLAVPRSKIFFVDQPWWPTFLKTLSHLPENS